MSASDRPDPTDEPLSRDFPVDAGTRPRRVGTVRAFPLGEAEMMLMHDGRQVIHTLNASAWAIWDLCDGEHSVGEITRILAADVERAAAELEGDVRGTIARLGSLGLLERA